MKFATDDRGYRPRLAIIAHDGKEADLVAFATFNRDRLQQCDLFATGTTGRLLIEKIGLAVERVESGPLGGDVQIAGRIADGRLDAVVFVVDPLRNRSPKGSVRCPSPEPGPTVWWLENYD